MRCLGFLKNFAIDCPWCVFFFSIIIILAQPVLFCCNLRQNMKTTLHCLALLISLCLVASYTEGGALKDRIQQLRDSHHARRVGLEEQAEVDQHVEADDAKNWQYDKPGSLTELRLKYQQQQISGKPSDKPVRLIFSLNTGRIGSKYLASLWGSCEEVLAFHEPGRAGGARNMQHERLEDTFALRKTIKVGFIRDQMAASDKTIYAESNPNFKTWFWDVTIETFARQEGKRVDILVVRKYLPAILKSIYEIGWYSRGPSRGNSWLPTANSVNSLIEPLAPDEELSPYERILSSLINTEAIAQKLKQMYSDPSSPHYLPNVHFHEYRSEELYQAEGALRMLKSLDLTPTPQTYDLAGQVIDKYRKGKESTGQLKRGATSHPTTLKRCEEEVEKYLQRCREAGIALPTLPHMEKYPAFVYKE